MDISDTQTTYPIHSSCLRQDVASWRQLTAGDAVVLLTSDKRNPRIMGKVDDVSTDGLFLWLLQDNGAGRRLFHRPDGYTTLLD